MKLNQIADNEGARKNRMRIGRGLEERVRVGRQWILPAGHAADGRIRE